MASIRTRKRPGPQPKGVRKQFTVRVPLDQYAVYKGEADARGITLVDYLAGVLARGHGLEEPAYLRRNRSPKEDMLPLTGTG